MQAQARGREADNPAKARVPWRSWRRPFRLRPAMSFAYTQPAELDSQDAGTRWSQFRIAGPLRQMETLRTLCRHDVPLTLGQSGGLLLQTTLWAVDEAALRLHFNADVEPRKIWDLIGLPEAWAAGYLDDAKVQFPVRSLKLETHGRTATLSCDVPPHILRLPRRGSQRVRRPHGGPVVRLQHPLSGDELELQVVDLSLTGCALRVPPGRVQLKQGLPVRAVEIELDERTVIFADLFVHHVTPERGQGGCSRAGCQWGHMSDGARDTLRQWIRQGQQHRSLARLQLDL
jgi:c-di-GMP-binding flagellar brake protein YcgR